MEHFAGKPLVSQENRWFLVDFPVNQPIEINHLLVELHPLYGVWSWSIAMAPLGRLTCHDYHNVAHNRAAQRC